MTRPTFVSTAIALFMFGCVGSDTKQNALPDSTAGAIERDESVVENGSGAAVDDHQEAVSPGRDMDKTLSGATVEFHALGQEPGWMLDISEGDSMLLRYDYGQSRLAAPTPSPEMTDSSVVYEANSSGTRWRVEIRNVPCQDSMSGQGYEATVEVVLGDRHMRGCGGKKTGPGPDGM
ncbi:MAG: hypothetical protein R2832_09810 [Rhodothermales bacterium]